MNVAQQLVRILEASGVKYVFGLPGEEVIALMDAIRQSSMTFVTCRHEQGAGFMADVFGRVSQELSVCLATLGPGATNLVTPVADAFMDYAPVLALTGQAASTRLYKTSHQVVDTKALFAPITKWSQLILASENATEVLQQAIKVAKTHPMGAVHIGIPEDVQNMACDECDMVKVQFPKPTFPNDEQLARAKSVIARATSPVILAGNGVFREGASVALQEMAETLAIPVVETYMGKGSIPNSHPMFVGVLGLPRRDAAYALIAQADVVIALGYDVVELEPKTWNPNMDKRIVHIGARPVEVDRYYQLEVGIQGKMERAIKWLTRSLSPFAMSARVVQWKVKARKDIDQALAEKRFPLSPAFVIHCLSQVLSSDDIVVSDVGAHKIWIGRLYPCERPGRCIISNGFASMGIAVPGGIGAALADPSVRVVTVSGDGGFLMNVQELETAKRLGLPLVHLVFNDGYYGLIKWKQHMQKLTPTNVDFTNPDFVALAKSFGIMGLRINKADEVTDVLREALSAKTQVVVDCPIDFTENIRGVSESE